MEEKMYAVYWIHFPDHTNLFSDGYIGISADHTTRVNKHRRGKLKGRFINGAEVTILAKNLLQHEALLLEKKFRPKCYIGWNTNSGGYMPPIPPKKLV